MANLDLTGATQGEATAYSGDGPGTGVIFFDRGTATGTVITVNPALGVDPETITSANGGRSLNFARAAVTGVNSFQFANGTVLIYGAAASEDLIRGVFADLLYGNAGDDVIESNNGDDQVFGGAGDDELSGVEGSVQIRCLAGRGPICSSLRWVTPTGPKPGPIATSTSRRATCSTSPRSPRAP